MEILKNFTFNIDGTKLKYTFFFTHTEELYRHTIVFTAY